MPYCAHCGAQIATLAPPCPSCGRPPSGAPPPVARAGGSHVVVVVAVVAAAGIVAILIVGILAAIAIPNLLNAMDRARQKRALADLRTIGAALEDYDKENHHYPAGTTVSEIKDALVPAYRPSLPELDGWKWKFRYMCWQEDPASQGCDHYRLASTGKDGILEHVDLREYAQGESQSFNCDIVFGSGDFVQWPAGIQR